MRDVDPRPAGGDVLELFENRLSSSEVVAGTAYIHLDGVRSDDPGHLFVDRREYGRFKALVSGKPFEEPEEELPVEGGAVAV